MVSVVCVLKSGPGNQYTPEYVRILRDSVARHWPKGIPLRFVCLTDYPSMAFGSVETMPLAYSFPGWWSKMELFSPRVRAELGPILYFDLDTAICGDLADIARYCTPAFPRGDESPFTVLEDFYRPGKYGSGAMFIPATGGEYVWDAFISGDTTKSATWRAHTHAFMGDQNFLEQIVPGAAFWQLVLPDRFVSFKPAPIFFNGESPTLKSLPKGATVVCFHGHPRPHETAPDSWIRDHWKADPVITSEDFHDLEAMAV